MTPDVDALLINARLEGTTAKRREAFRNSINWATLIFLLEEIKRLRRENELLEKAMENMNPSL